MTVLRPVYLLAALFVLILVGFAKPSSAQEIVLYASQAPVKVGNWTAAADSGAAGGARLSNQDMDAPKITTASGNPKDYFELSFNASAGIPYRLWVRGRTLNNSAYNDSVFVQFSGSVNSSGSAVYRIGTTSATEMNLEDCSGCGLSGWGWQDNGWGVGVLGPQIYFQSTGTQTMRIQVREDGFSIDQIVLSPSKYLFSSPGALKNDTVILAQSDGATTSSTSTTLTESPNNTRVPTATQIVDSNLAVWTLSNGAILRNGAGTSGAGSQILYCNRIVYALGTDSAWWRWSNGWSQVGFVDPCDGSTSTSLTESPNNTRVPTATQIVDSSLAVWTLSSGAILRNGAGTSGAGSQILYCDRIVYALGTDSAWWRWSNGWSQVGFVDPCGGTTSSPTPSPTPTSSISPDIVIWASNVPSTGVRGAWTAQSSSTAAGQILLRHPDGGGKKISNASANPADYFEVTFDAEAGKPYRLWIRGRADNNSWANDSVFAQFSGSLDSNGQAVYRIGTTSAAEVNLEDCSNCGLSGWGWQDNGWGVGILGPAIFFQSTGAQTLRIQTREDGFAIDQIVISSYAYLFTSPGALKNDTVILQSTIASSSPSPTPTPAPNQAPTVSISATPTSGTSPLFVSFSAGGSDPDGYIASYQWNFGNGVTSTAQNPTYTYQSAGEYTAKVTVTDNAGATASATVQIYVTSSTSTTGGSLRVLSWNVAFGQGTDGVRDYGRTAQYIANMNPDLIGLCEMPSDQIGTLLNALTQKTGRTWYWHFAPKYDGTTEGNLILSKYSFSSTGHRYLSYQRSVAQATLSIGGRTINFFATHLDHESSSTRYLQAGEVLTYASGFSENKIIVGDFNAGPDTSESVRMTSAYYDSWMRAMNAGTAAAYPDNPIGMHTRTRRGRIDYVFYSLSAPHLFLQGTQIPDTRDLNNTNVVITLGTLDDKGVRPSDHNPMIGNFSIQ